MNATRQRQIHRYLETLFGSLRRFLQDEPGYVQYVPDVFKFAYVFLVFECSNGYAVAAYPSGFADNYIYIDKDVSVVDALRGLPNLIAGTKNHVVLKMDVTGSGLLEACLDRVETNRGPVPTTGWKFLFAASKDFTWPVHEARGSAREYVGIFKARAAVYRAGEGGFVLRYDRALARHELVSRLHQILERYRGIITETDYKERQIHRFLRDNPVLLIPTKRRMVYEYPLKEDGKVRFVVDFVIERTSGAYILVELENPKHKLFTAKGDFSQIVSHAERQVSDWMLHIRKNVAAIESEFPGIKTPEGLIVVGRSSDLSEAERDKIRMRNEKHLIRLVTYDELAEEAENHINHLLEA